MSTSGQGLLPSSKQIRAGVIGFGLAGRIFHAPFLAAVPSIDLAAIVQRTGDTAAAAYPKTTIYRSVEELFNSDVDLIVVATPNDSHLAMAAAALKAGKHVVVDKPVAGTRAEVESLRDLALQQKRLLVPFHNRRFDGDFLTVRELLNKGSVGRLSTFRSRFDRFRPMQKEGTWKEAGGAINSLLLDLGPHLVDQALALFGRPDTVAVSTRRERDSSNIDDAFDITLSFTVDGRTVRAELGATMLAAESAPRYVLQGTRGGFIKYGLDSQEPALIAGAQVPALGSVDDWLGEPEESWGTLTVAPDPAQPKQLKRDKVQTLPGDYRVFYQGVAEAILRGVPPPITAQDAVRVAHVLDLATESSHTGRTLPVTEELW